MFFAWVLKLFKTKSLLCSSFNLLISSWILFLIIFVTSTTERIEIIETKNKVKETALRKPTKPKSGNVKLAPEPTPKPVDDNIGNRIEPVKKKTVRRAKNDPRA